MKLKLLLLLKNWKIFILSIAVLVTANIFNGVLNISSFEKLYTDAVISIYREATVNLKRTIERPIKFGKPIHKFLGIDALLSGFQEEHPLISDVSVALPTGEINLQYDSL